MLYEVITPLSGRIDREPIVHRRGPQGGIRLGAQLGFVEMHPVGIDLHVTIVEMETVETVVLRLRPGDHA